MDNKLFDHAHEFFKAKGWTAFNFQKETWQHFLEGKSGLLNAPTGSGKTYALWIPILLNFIQKNPDSWKSKSKNGLQAIWITPLRALSEDIQKAMQEVCQILNLPWRVEVRHGDTSAKLKTQQKSNPPECLITTPETLQILISQKDHPELFKNLQCVIIDEWHDLLGNKRGVQIQLALSYLKYLKSESFQIWGISATIGNLLDAKEILIGQNQSQVLVRYPHKKQVKMQTVFPDELEKYPWSGHLGLKLLDKVIQVIEDKKTVLLFCNTRAQTEIWYQNIIEARPDWSGWVAMHHGSLDHSVRTWVESALHSGQLKLVVCTSSLDLGVDFRPVEAVIQIGSPKGVSRFAQRAGRSGHRPGEMSQIIFVPTNALELIEAAALREAIDIEGYESVYSLEKPIDVLIQFLVTLAVGVGFDVDTTYQFLRSTFSYRHLTPAEYQWIISFITVGGDSLGSYEEFSKVVKSENDLFRVVDKKIAMRHRLSMGTIVSDPMLKVKFSKGSYLGMIEENFLSKLKAGDCFFFSGRNLEFIKIKDLTAYVKLSDKKSKNTPAYMGGRISLTSKLSHQIRGILEAAQKGIFNTEEIQHIQPLLFLQQKLSIIPDRDTFLIEKHQSKEGHHLFFYPFEGRYVHEIIGALVAYRISVSMPVSFSIAMNDYGFELMSDIKIPIEEFLEEGLFATNSLEDDIISSINESQMAKRKFREIASIAGLIFQGYPGKPTTFKHLQTNSGILYGVFQEYDPENLLLKQAHQEVLDLHIGQTGIHQIFEKLNHQQIIIKNPGQFTPFSFPIMVDRLRAMLSSESLEDRLNKIRAQMIN
jgi:ATP-dependent helicase Lhr and Lhr-like helicase